MHCASKDDDLGNHLLKQHEDLHWHFCQDVFSYTKFSCDFQWGDKKKKFDVFQHNLAKICAHKKVCSWTVKSDGFYFSADKPEHNKKYTWE